MITPEPPDFRHVPFSSIASRLGFSYNWHGTPMHRSGWSWASAFCNHHPTPMVAPFARLEGHDSPDVRSNLGWCEQRMTDSNASFYFVQQDGVQTILRAPIATRCHFGSPRLKVIDAHTAVCDSDHGWWMVLHAPTQRLEQRHSGVTVTTTQEHIAIGCGLGEDQATAMRRAVDASRLSPEEARAASERPWRDALANVPEIALADAGHARVYAESWWTLLSNTVSPRGLLTHRGIYPDRMYHNAIWLWDACFHAAAVRHADPQLAREQLLILLDNQQPDGMIADVVRDDRTYLANSKPPLIAWGAWKVHEVDPDPDFLAAIYPKLCLLDQWWFTRRDPNGNGLPGYEHPFAAGTDDSPAFDGLDLGSATAELEAPDLAAYLFNQRSILSQIADVLGDHTAADDWRNGAATLAERAHALYDAADDFFYARRDGNRVDVRIPHWLQAARMLPKPDARRLLRRWLVEQPQFEQKYLLATVALDEPSYDPLRWRGGAWLNINQLVAETAAWADLPDVATHIAQRSLDMVASHTGIWEHYDVADGAPGGPATFGMTASACIEFAMMLSSGTQREAI